MEKKPTFILIMAILVTISIYFPLSAQAADEIWIFGETSENSLVPKERLETVYRIVENGLTPNRSDEQLIALINTELRNLGLPQIRYETSSIVESVFITSFDTVPVGVEVIDGNYRFCLPCSGFNDFSFGIVKSRDR